MSATRVIVVDDSRVMRKIILRMVTAMGFATLEAGNGAEALAVIDGAWPDGPPDLALVDWNMPEMNGVELVARMRADARLDGLRIVMVTSESEIERVEEALDAGADEYLMKPFDQAALAEKLAMVGIVGAEPVT